MQWLTALLIVLGTSAVAGPVSDKRETSSMKPDFSQVKSLAEAQALAVKGKLVKVLLFPAEFGGEDIPENTTYLTPEAAQAKGLVTGTLVRYVKEGLINKLTVQPEYKGDSFVPSRIVMHATHNKKSGEFNPTVEVW